MRRRSSAAERAKYLLHTASQKLHTANPVQMLGNVIEDAMPLPVGDAAYQDQKLLEPTFSETAARNLQFSMETGGPGATMNDRIGSATQVIRWMVDNGFGPKALYWLDGNIEPARRHGYQTRNWGAWIGSGFDHHGMNEATITYGWGDGLTDALPTELYQMARIALDSLPGLQPALLTVRCGRSSGSQQLTLAVDYPLPLANLQPMMEHLGLGHQHASLTNTMAFLLGTRFVLPPGTTTITLIPTRMGCEMRLDVNLDALPDPPPQLLSLLHMQMTERPRSLRHLEQWLTALTPDGYYGPGSVTVLSVRVRSDMPARVALYLRPAALVDRRANNEPVVSTQRPADQPVDDGR